MATTQPQSESSDDADVDVTANERTLTLEASGTATRYRGRKTDNEAIEITDEVEVDVSLDFTIEELEKWVLNKNACQNITLSRNWENYPMGDIRDWVNDALEDNRVIVGRDSFTESWDVMFDGNVRAWLDLLERTNKPHEEAQKLRHHDEFGSGLDAAVMELERRQ